MITWLKKEEKYHLENILKGLPAWFGIEDAIQIYVKDSYCLPVLAYKDNGKIAGFITLKETSESTLEIYVMGIMLEYHRKGIGALMVSEVKKYAQKEGYKFLLVKTLSPEVQDANYLQSYAFYKAMQFQDVEVLPLWDENNPCLLMIQSI